MRVLPPCYNIPTIYNIYTNEDSEGLPVTFTVFMSVITSLSIVSFLCLSGL